MPRICYRFLALLILGFPVVSILSCTRSTTPVMATNSILAGSPSVEVFGEAPEVFRPLSVATRPGEDINWILVRAKAHWMSEPLELRFPEVLTSSNGMYFMDHFIPGMDLIYPIEPAIRWEHDPVSGDWSYSHRFPDGFEFGGSATPAPGAVDLVLWFRNGTEDTIQWATANPCLSFGATPEHANQWSIEHLWASFPGGMKPLSTTSPTPEEKGREPWLLLLTRRGLVEYEGADDSPTWWLVDQHMHHNLMASVSRDGKYLIGYAWNEEDRHCMTNTGNPCLHTGPGPATMLKPGESRRFFGRLYFMENDMEKLVAAYKEDVLRWNQLAGDKLK